jgi:hypothetical protein
MTKIWDKITPRVVEYIVSSGSGWKYHSTDAHQGTKHLYFIAIKNSPTERTKCFHSISRQRISQNEVNYYKIDSTKQEFIREWGREAMHNRQQQPQYLFHYYTPHTHTYSLMAGWWHRCSVWWWADDDDDDTWLQTNKKQLPLVPG